MAFGVQVEEGEVAVAVGVGGAFGLRSGAGGAGGGGLDDVLDCKGKRCQRCKPPWVSSGGKGRAHTSYQSVTGPAARECLRWRGRLASRGVGVAARQSAMDRECEWLMGQLTIQRLR